MPDLPERAPTEAARQKVIDKLTMNYAHDNLDDAQFEERLSRATNATSATELAALVADLPDIADKSRHDAAAASEPGTIAINTGVVREQGTFVAILGGSDRRGVWRPPRHMTVFTMLGGVDLDFTKAEMPPGVTEVTVLTLLGGVDITVPPGMNVEVSGIPFLGGFDDRSGGAGNPNEPTLKIRGVAILGGVDIKVPRKLRKLLGKDRNLDRMGAHERHRDHHRHRRFWEEEEDD